MFYILINIILGNDKNIADQINYLVSRAKQIDITSRFGTYQLLTSIQLSNISQLSKITNFAKDIIINSGIMSESDINELEQRNGRTAIKEDLIDSIAKFSDLLNLTD